MNDLDRIEDALRDMPLSHIAFERCAQDLLTELFPGLSPIPGGTDWGRDADIAGSGETAPPRLLATSARTLDGVRTNMRRGIKSMKEHGVPVDRIVLANPASLSLLDRQKLVAAARKAEVALDVSGIFDRGFFASRLRRDGYWRQRLLDLSSEPITLSPKAPELAESPWAILPLVAREEDVEAIQGTDDLILTGPPGIGKSRVAEELSGSVFVDKDARFEQISSDLRWASPTTVIVDDAGGQNALIRRLRGMRQSEPDLFTFRMVAICWPDEVEDVLTGMATARVHRLDLLDRGPMDDLVQAMGISGWLARQEILNQAEGHPAWAIALADLLLQASDVRSLLSGKALLGQVERYLRRSGVGTNVMDVLAMVAALGGVTDRDLDPLAEKAGLTRPNLAAVLHSTATSGLIDVVGYQDEDGLALRSYAVRPPMLANVLVAERLFAAPVPAVDFGGLVERWPERLGNLAHAAVSAALLGTANTRSLADSVTNRALASQIVQFETKVDLAGRFLQLDQPAGEHVLSVVRASFNEALTRGDSEGALEPFTGLAAAVAARYETDAAFELLFDAAAVDRRPTNPHPGHPIRRIAHLVEGYHPEVPRNARIRYKIADALLRWLEQASDDPARHKGAANILPTLLSLKLRSVHPDPGRPMTIQLGETIIPAEEIREVFRELWPVSARLLDHAGEHVARPLIGVAGEWLHIGSGNDQPFGRNHRPDRVGAAREVGEALVANLAARSDLGLGLRHRLRSTAIDYGLPVTIEIPAEVEVFFRNTFRLGASRPEAEQELVTDLQALGRAWASEDPRTTVGRLTELRTELEAADLRWPDRVAIVCAAIADQATNPITWLDAADAAGLMPEGCHFARCARGCPGLRGT